ncbi:hypothetical protein ADUPG1_013684 [Aduncisulcus paluster]|uniref:LisH domain-containing protein n=1 Tax=Aduncisulcus paluster TaxID=2918883 RepID=A0ABQ5K5L9_9EUKA|nr:hypothetical protein ADUPG1_013684 [Aduncisulcus paluster]
MSTSLSQFNTLRNAVVSVLDADDVLSKVKALMRAHVFCALEGERLEKDGESEYPKGDFELEMLSTVIDFLDAFGLHKTLSVLSAETDFAKRHKIVDSKPEHKAIANGAREVLGFSPSRGARCKLESILKGKESLTHVPETKSYKSIPKEKTIFELEDEEDKLRQEAQQRERLEQEKIRKQKQEEEEKEKKLRQREEEMKRQEEAERRRKEEAKRQAEEEAQKKLEKYQSASTHSPSHSTHSPQRLKKQLAPMSIPVSSPGRASTVSDSSSNKMLEESPSSSTSSPFRTAPKKTPTDSYEEDKLRQEAQQRERLEQEKIRKQKQEEEEKEKKLRQREEEMKRQEEAERRRKEEAKRQAEEEAQKKLEKYQSASTHSPSHSTHSPQRLKKQLAPMSIPVSSPGRASTVSDSSSNKMLEESPSSSTSSPFRTAPKKTPTAISTPSVVDIDQESQTDSIEEIGAGSHEPTKKKESSKELTEPKAKQQGDLFDDEDNLEDSFNLEDMSSFEADFSDMALEDQPSDKKEDGKAKEQAESPMVEVISPGLRNPTFSTSLGEDPTIKKGFRPKTPQDILSATTSSSRPSTADMSVDMSVNSTGLTAFAPDYKQNAEKPSSVDDEDFGDLLDGSFDDSFDDAF